MINPPAARIAAGFFLVILLVFASKLNDAQPKDDFTIIVAPLPKFDIDWHRGQLNLSGHTLSQEHEIQLLQVVQSSYPNAAVRSDFEPLGIVPEAWQAMTVQVLYLLAESDSSSAEISSETIAIRAVAKDELGWKTRLDAVTSSLPETISIAADTVVVDSSINIANVCRRAYSNFTVGPVNFEESTAVFRNSAFPRLDRVVALAAVCTESRIAVSGHTDSSGSAAANQRLSLLRATAVGDYFVRAGVEPERLLISGFGSAKPITSNASRYGRSLNRRIEVDFQP